MLHMLTKTFTKSLVRCLLLILIVLTPTTQVQAAGSLYAKFCNTYGIATVEQDTSGLQNRLNTLYSDLNSAAAENALATSSQNIENMISSKNNEIKEKTTSELNDLDSLKKNTSAEIENSVLTDDLSSLSTLVAEYESYDDKTKVVLEERNSLYKLVGITKKEYVELEPIEQEIMKYKSAIDEASVSKINLGVLSELKRPYKYETIITSECGYRLHPIWGDTRYHNAMDYAMSEDTELYSLFNGTVIEAGWNGGYGYNIRIDCGDGIVVHYAHLNSIRVKEGQNVAQNELIGYSGNTGDSTGPHLHLGLYYHEQVLRAEDLFN